MPLILFHSPSPPLPNASSTLLSNPNSTFYSYVSISSSLKEKPPQNPKLTNSTSTSPHSLEPISFSNGGIKMPTPPWMNGPLVLQPQEVLDLAKPRKMKTRDNNKAEKFDGALTSKLIGRRGKNAVKKIVRSIEKLGETNNLEDMNNDSEQLRIGYCLEQLAQARDSRIGEKMPWERDEEIVFRRMKKERAVSAAELSLEKELLERLRGEAAKMRQWVKVKKAGVTQAVVDNIKLIWMRNELAMVKFDVPLCRNMDRAQEIVEVGWFIHYGLLLAFH